MEKVSPPDANGCRLFKINKNQRYGTIRLNRNEIIGAHVAAAIAFYGPVPDGMEVCHKCDNPACVNPQHLYFGTHSDNIMDAVLRDRRSTKLTVEDVRAIRYLQVPVSLIAELYDIDRSTVWSIRKGRKKHWAWLR